VHAWTLTAVIHGRIKPKLGLMLQQ